MAVFGGFTKYFSELLDCNTSYWYLLNSLAIILHWKLAKISRVDEVSLANFGPT